MNSSSFDLTTTKFWSGLRKVIEILMNVGSIVSTAVMVIAVFMRYLLTKNFYGSDEIIMLFAFWLYFMGAAYGSYEDSHIKADLLSVYVHNMRAKDLCAIIAQVLTVAVNTIVLVWATKYFITEIGKWPLTTALRIPLVIPKSAMFFGFLLMEFYHVVYLIDMLKKYIKNGYFSTPGPLDYMPEAAKAKYPGCSIPTKEELPANTGKESE